MSAQNLTLSQRHILSSMQTEMGAHVNRTSTRRASSLSNLSALSSPSFHHPSILFPLKLVSLGAANINLLMCTALVAWLQPKKPIWVCEKLLFYWKEWGKSNFVFTSTGKLEKSYTVINTSFSCCFYGEEARPYILQLCSTYVLITKCIWANDMFQILIII